MSTDFEKDDRDLDVAGESRRRWMVTSAAALAGTVAACSSDGDSQVVLPDDVSCFPGNAPPESLPSFNATRCTSDIDSASVPADDDRFTAWNAALRENAAGRESAFVDLDAVDHNLKRVGDALGSSIALRLVAKSLPSVQLLESMMITACTNRIMAFSEGMVRDLLCRFGSSVDILLGRPATVHAAARVFDTLEETATGGPNPATSVRWLVDTAARMQEYADLADELQVVWQVAAEIDVGLRRGGARTEDELLAMLDVIDQSSGLQLSGFMGYEGHVGFAPEGADPERELEAVQQRYGAFVDAARAAYPSMFDRPLVYNSGGSRTYHYYTDDLDTVVNEVAMGSAFLYPSNFSNIPDTELRRAAFLATPVLKRVDPAEAPFAPGFLPTLAEDNPSLEVQFVMLTGGFPGGVVYPEGLVKNPVTSSADACEQSVINLLPNQGEWLGERALSLDVGDYIFYQAWEGDGLRWLRYLDVFRGSDLVDQWPTFQPGIAATSSDAT